MYSLGSIPTKIVMVSDFEQEPNLKIWKCFGPGSGSTFKNFGSGADSESENVTPPLLLTRPLHEDKKSH